MYDGEVGMFYPCCFTHMYGYILWERPAAAAIDHVVDGLPGDLGGLCLFAFREVRMSSGP